MSRLLRLFSSSSRHVQGEPRASPVPAAPHDEYSQHRHATADFTEAEDDDEEDTNDEGRQRYPGEQRADRNEDGLPADVLPLFSTTTLGNAIVSPGTSDEGSKQAANSYLMTRYLARLQHNACTPSHRPDQNRDHFNMGPTTVPPGVPVPGQAHARADSCPALFSGHVVRTHGQLSSIFQGRPAISWPRWY